MPDRLDDLRIPSFLRLRFDLTHQILSLLNVVVLRHKIGGI